MSKAMVYAVNSATQTVAPNGSVNFGTPVRRFGCSTNVLNGNVVTKGQGYYKVGGDIVFTATAGTLVAEWFKDGVAIPGASYSVTTVADTTYSLNVGDFVIRECCPCDDNSVLTLVISGVTATITNATVLAERM